MNRKSTFLEAIKIAYCWDQKDELKAIIMREDEAAFLKRLLSGVNNSEEHHKATLNLFVAKRTEESVQEVATAIEGFVETIKTENKSSADLMRQVIDANQSAAFWTKWLAFATFAIVLVELFKPCLRKLGLG